MFRNPATYLQLITQRLQYNAGRFARELGLTMDRYGSRMSNDIAYRLDFTRHRQILPLYDAVPRTKDAWIAPNATLVGNVILSKYATIWYGAVLRGDMNPVRVGHFSSIGDGTVVQTFHSLPHGMPASVNIGKNVTIGTKCTLHSCIIDDDCVIGDNVVI